MKHSHVWLVATSLSLFIIAAGCHDRKGGTGGGPSTTSTGAGGSGGSAPVDLFAASCPGNSMIGRLEEGGSCPDGAPWTATSIFASKSLKGMMPTYCLYEWDVAGAPDLAKLPLKNDKIPPLDWLDRDCAVVASLTDASDATAAVIPALSSAFLTQIENPGPVQAPAGLTPVPVRVAIIDSWPSLGTVGNSPHGAAMAGLIQQVAVDTLALPSGAITATPDLALNLIEPGQRDNANGGYFGFQSRLARTVFDAVESWDNGPMGVKLILNLSVGWDARFNKSTVPGAPLSLAAQAAHDALVYAACRGALIFAAAGNSTGAPTPPPNPNPSEGPTYPAAWESEPAPAITPMCPNSPGKGPLLHAVGGVDGFDARLPNARPKGRPVLAAPAFQVPSSTTIGGPKLNLGPFTGSSVSSAVASAVAAAIWHFDGTLQAFDVATKLRTSGEPLGDTADFCVSSPGCLKIHRISLCRALRDTKFPALVCPEIAAGKGKNAEWTTASIAAYELKATTIDARSADTASPAPPPGCSTEVFVAKGTMFGDAFAGARTDTAACPSEQYDDNIVNVALAPQPPCTPCPACQLQLPMTIGDPMVLELAIEEGLSYDPTPMVLTLSSDKGAVERYDLHDAVKATLGDGSLRAGSVYKFELPATKSAYRGDFQYATVEWLDARTLTQTTSALLISPN